MLYDLMSYIINIDNIIFDILYKYNRVRMVLFVILSVIFCFVQFIIDFENIIVMLFYNI